MRQPNCVFPRAVPETSFPEVNHKHDPLIEGNPSRGKHVSTNWGGKSIFPRSYTLQTPSDQMPQFL